jgi:hypothetical protein
MARLVQDGIDLLAFDVPYDVPSQHPRENGGYSVLLWASGHPYRYALYE